MLSLAVACGQLESPVSGSDAQAARATNAASWKRGEPAPAIDGFQCVGVSASGLPEYDLALSTAVSMRFVLLPSASFLMGAACDDQLAPSSERPRQQVSMSAFLISKTECTQAHWQAVMGTSPSYFRLAGPEAPVEQVSFDAALAFVARAGLSLPSEAQWEYACQGAAPGPASGEPGATQPEHALADLSQRAWFADNSEVTYAGGRRHRPPGGSVELTLGTHPVGTKQPNAFGLHDMLGNVEEWCLDTHSASLSGTPVDGAARSEGEMRVTRGGGWATFRQSCRCSFRNGHPPDHESFDLGFRPVFHLAPAEGS